MAALVAFTRYLRYTVVCCEQRSSRACGTWRGIRVSTGVRRYVLQNQERAAERYQHDLNEGFVQVCLRILDGSRSELYMNMRYLDLALSSLRYQVVPYEGWGHPYDTESPVPAADGGALQVSVSPRPIATDGHSLVADPRYLADLYERNRLQVNRVYLHCVMHCLLRHIFKKRRANALLWRLSCDIAVESIIDSMYVRAVRTGVSRTRRNWYDYLHTRLKVLTAEGVYRVLEEKGLTPFEWGSLAEAFCIDDHCLWPAPQDPQAPPPPEMEMLQNSWEDISEKTQTRMDSFAQEQAEGAGDLSESLKVENRERMDYKTFLRKFAVLREQVMVDPDSFDYVFYAFGLSMYGNMPLIEPQESREVQRIEEFVIVLDVSMSTQGELVRTFLEQTYAVLSESETYLRKIHIRIIQCDEQVRSDVKITSQEELKNYMENFRLEGGGGTDFRPAFAYVQNLVETKQLRDLRGMIYFTDGRGIYPKRKPQWESAFVFMQEDYTDVDVPAWAIKLILEREQLEEEAEQLRTDFTFV